MENKFQYSSDNKRYHTWNYHLRRKFGCKVFKVSLNAGFTCPNIDGTRGTGGCTYCSGTGSGDFAGDPSADVCTQFDEIKGRMHKKWTQGKYIAYFQAHTNTYASVSRLRAVYEPILKKENVVGISIATRADALSKDVLDYLSELNNRTYLIVELGLQSIFDETGKRINRCHTYAEFLESYRRLTERGIDVCVHLIDGLPGETHEMMVESVRTVGLLRPACVKLHLLHILRSTPIALDFEQGKLRLLTREEYVDIICDQLEVLPAETVIQRLTGDGGRNDLLGPMWSLKKFEVLNEIDKELLRRNSYQGRLFKGD